MTATLEALMHLVRRYGLACGSMGAGTATEALVKAEFEALESTLSEALADKAQPAEQEAATLDAMTDKAWGRFEAELAQGRKVDRVHAIADAGPFPGMSRAFNAHMGAECWIDPDYAPDASTWAAAWKAAIAAQPVALAAPVAVPQNLVSDREYLALFDAAREGSDKPSGTLRGIRACIAAYEAAQPVPQPGYHAHWTPFTVPTASIAPTEAPNGQA